MSEKLTSLVHYQTALILAETALRWAPHQHKDEARDRLRRASENLRVFTYKQKGSLTNSGHLLRP